MGVLVFRSMLTTGQQILDSSVSDVALMQLDGAAFAYATTERGGGIVAYRLQEGNLAALVDTEYFGPAISAGVSGRITVQTMAGQTRLLIGEDGIQGVVGYSLDGGMIGSAFRIAVPLQGNAISATANLASSGGELFFTADANIGGIASYRLANGAYNLSATATDTAASHAINVVAMATLEWAGASYLFSACTAENGLTSYRVDVASGALEIVGTMGADKGLGITAPTALKVIEAHGEAYLLLASAGSSTLSVMRVTEAGALVPTDQILDNRYTRFAQAQTIETVTVNGHVYVIAGGGDDGISLFALLPNGRLLHLDTIADGLDSGLTNISAISAVQVGQEVQIVVAAQGAPGLTLLAFSVAGLGTVQNGTAGADQITGTARADVIVGGAGNDRLTGQAGADILEDGAGQDSLTGGLGADLFVLRADGAHDVILDFEPGSDQLDLSDFPMFYDPSQLGYTATPNGAQLTWYDETIELRRQGGGVITWAEVLAAIRVGPDRPFMAVSQDTQGSASNDLLIGYWGADFMEGHAGDDSISGGDGDDNLSGGEGNDLLFGEAGHDLLTGEEGDDTLFGDDGDDTLDGGLGADELHGGHGHDSLTGGDGNDQLHGGSGFDTIDAGTGDDRVWGGDGRDYVLLGDGNDLYYDTPQGGYLGQDRVWGGAGNDTIFVGNGDDTLDGGLGADELHGMVGNDSLIGGDGNDRIFGGSGFDTIEAGTGDDRVWGGDGRDYVLLGDGNDLYYDTPQGGYLGQDRVWGGAGNDTIFVGNGDDTLDGGPGADELHGMVGNDSLIGGDGNDRIFGGSGFDTIDAGTGDDTVWGELGRDTVLLGDGNDIFYDTPQGGYLGQDRVWGGAGNDTIHAGGGNDTLTGDAGADVFVFYPSSDQNRITDFTPGEDLIRIEVLNMSFRALSLTSSANGAVVNWGSGQVTLDGVLLNELSAADFLFI